MSSKQAIIVILKYLVPVGFFVAVFCRLFAQHSPMKPVSSITTTNNDIMESMPVRFHFTDIGKGGSIYVLKRGERTMSYSEVIDGLANGQNSLIRALTNAVKLFPGKAIYWECAPTSKSLFSTQSFEFVILPSSSLESISPDIHPFQDKFLEHRTSPYPPPSSEGVVTFHNLRKDAMLVVPAPIHDSELSNPPRCYAHMSEFMRGASSEHTAELWTVIGRAMQNEIFSAEDPHKRLWLSTAGDGVSWLHVRIDTVPKYYKYSAYKHMHK